MKDNDLEIPHDRNIKINTKITTVNNYNNN